MQRSTLVRVVDGVWAVAQARPGDGADVDDLPGEPGEQVLAVTGDPACFQCPAHRRECGRRPDCTPPSPTAAPAACTWCPPELTPSQHRPATSAIARGPGRAFRAHDGGHQNPRHYPLPPCRLYPVSAWPDHCPNRSRAHPPALTVSHGAPPHPAVSDRLSGRIAKEPSRHNLMRQVAAVHVAIVARIARIGMLSCC
jgi:hypothetical protein